MSKSYPILHYTHLLFVTNFLLFLSNRLIQGLNEIRVKEGLCRILVHTDAAQAIGKISVDVKDLGVDYLTIVGHKVISKLSFN